MHIILRGVGPLLLDILNVDNTNSTKYYYTIGQYLDEYVSVNCIPFLLTNKQWLTFEIYNAIGATQKYISAKFEGDFF